MAEGTRPRTPSANESSAADALPGFRRGVENLETMKREAHRAEKASEKLADFFTSFSGSMVFVYLHAVWFLVWVAWNTKLIPGLEPFDPFPFGLLTLVVSLEAIFLSTFVLISQNREKVLSAMRDEIETQVNLYQEQELTHVLRIVHRIEKHLGIEDEDEETVAAMECFVDSDGLFRQIESKVLKKSE